MFRKSYRWKPSVTEKREYHQRMLAIEENKSSPLPEGYTINCTGDCCKGDEITYFNPAKDSERLFGTIINESYGKEKQQHTFSIEHEDGSISRIKGRNLYKSEVYRKLWLDESKRIYVLDEKHKRGDKARKAKSIRKFSELEII